MNQSTLFANESAVQGYRKSTLKQLPKGVEVLMSNNLQEVKCSYKPDKTLRDKKPINSSKGVYEELQAIWDGDKLEYLEEFIILLLNRQNKIMGWVKVSQGGQAGTVADPKIIFQHALTANASSIILSHNHPSGNLKPSQADIDLTRKLKNAGAMLDLPVLDHIIMTANGFYSFLDEGLL